MEDAPVAAASARLWVMISRNSSASKSACRRSKLKAWPRPSRAGVAGAAGGVHPGFGDGGARRVVLVEHLAPFDVDLVDFVAVPEGVRAVVEPVRAGVGRAQLQLGEQRFGEVLGQGVRHVHAEAVHAAVGPEAQGLEEVVADLAVGPVQVRLLLGEDVHVPLAGGAVRFGDAFPGRIRRRRSPSPTAGTRRWGPCRHGRCSGRARRSPSARRGPP